MACVVIAAIASQSGATDVRSSGSNAAVLSWPKALSLRNCIDGSVARLIYRRRSVGSPTPLASKPPSTASTWPLM
jgi:hypothetical protein